MVSGFQPLLVGKLHSQPGKENNALFHCIAQTWLFCKPGEQRFTGSDGSGSEAVPDGFAIDMMLSAMSGAMRSAFEVGASPAMFRKMRQHLVLLCQSYMAAATTKGA